jgi:hypothetical protein
MPLLDSACQLRHTQDHVNCASVLKDAEEGIYFSDEIKPLFGKSNSVPGAVFRMCLNLVRLVYVDI